MKPTNAQIERTARDYSEIAGEDVKVEFVNSTMYVFGSELAILRIANKTHAGRTGFSENLESCFYAKDLY